MTGWRDISSAPKDGRIIMTTMAGGDPAVSFWVECERAWCFASYDYDHKARGYMGGRAIPVPQPTHWLPLPDPPSSP